MFAMWLIKYIRTKSQEIMIISRSYGKIINVFITRNDVS